MMGDVRLTPVSYVVLGLIEHGGPATPYDLKQRLALGPGNLWSVQHAQMYSEPQRLAAAGYLSERREEGGRRRRTFLLERRGRDALRRWLAEPAATNTELRDPGLLKLYFGAEPRALASGQLAAHRAKLAEYERAMGSDPGDEPRGPWLALEMGIAAERAWIRFWSALA